MCVAKHQQRTTEVTEVLISLQRFCQLHYVTLLLYMQNTELKFDLVSPVDELAKQLRMEFDFLHEAETMDAVGEHLMVSVMQGAQFSIKSPCHCIAVP